MKNKEVFGGETIDLVYEVDGNKARFTIKIPKRYKFRAESNPNEWCYPGYLDFGPIICSAAKVDIDET